MPIETEEKPAGQPEAKEQKPEPKMIPEEDLNKFKSESQKRESQLRKEARQLREEMESLKGRVTNDDDDDAEDSDKGSKEKPSAREQRRLDRQRQEIAKREFGIALREAAAKHGVSTDDLEEAADEEQLPRGDVKSIQLLAAKIAAERKAKEIESKAAADAVQEPRTPTPSHGGGIGTPSWESAQKITKVTDLSDEDYFKLVGSK